MQSPLVIVLRTSVLLGCLGFLPLWAAGGLAAPGAAYSAAAAWLAKQTGSEPLTAPRIIQVELPEEALCYRDAPTSPDWAWADESGDHNADVTPVNYEEILPPADRDLTTAADSTRTPNWATISPANAVGQASFTPNLPAAEANLSPSGHTLSAASPTAMEIEARLRALGASEFRLEPWGSGGQFYRCCAVLAVAGSFDVQRHFQAIGADPAQAASDVLAQVEARFQR